VIPTSSPNYFCIFAAQRFLVGYPIVGGVARYPIVGCLDVIGYPIVGVSFFIGYPIVGGCSRLIDGFPAFFVGDPAFFVGIPPFSWEPPICYNVTSRRFDGCALFLPYVLK
jgi:hypothetical protein